MPAACLESLRHALRHAICCGDYGIFRDAGGGGVPNSAVISRGASIEYNGFIGEHVLSIEEAYRRALIRVAAPYSASEYRVSNEIAPHLALMYRYARRSECVVELGVNYATSTIAWIRGLRDNGSDRKILRMVDRVRRTGAVANRLDLAFRAGIDVAFIEVDSLKYTMPVPPCDLLFIDTLHVYGQLRRELAQHSQFVRQWILLHDTGLYGNRGECADTMLASEACEHVRQTWDFTSDELNGGLADAVRDFLNGPLGNPWSIEARLNSLGTGLTVLRHETR